MLCERSSRLSVHFASKFVDGVAHGRLQGRSEVLQLQSKVLSICRTLCSLGPTLDALSILIHSQKIYISYRSGPHTFLTTISLYLVRKPFSFLKGSDCTDHSLFRSFKKALGPHITLKIKKQSISLQFVSILFLGLLWDDTE